MINKLELEFSLHNTPTSSVCVRMLNMNEVTGVSKRIAKHNSLVCILRLTPPTLTRACVRANSSRGFYSFRGEESFFLELNMHNTKNNRSDRHVGMR